VNDYPKEVSFFALLDGLAGRAGLVVKAVAEPHALQTGSPRCEVKSIGCSQISTDLSSEYAFLAFSISFIAVVSNGWFDYLLRAID